MVHESFSINSRIEIGSCFKVNSRLRKQDCTTDIRVQIYDSVLVNEMRKRGRVKTMQFIFMITCRYIYYISPKYLSPSSIQSVL